MPARRAPRRALYPASRLVGGLADSSHEPRHRAGTGGRVSRLSAVVLAASVVCGGLGLAAPVAANAASTGVAARAAVSAPAASEAAVIVMGHGRLHNTLRHRKEPAAVPLGVQAVRLAASRRGDPYVWGAAGPRAFDCSGLVMWVYDHLGKRLPRTAGAQYNATRHISHSQLRPGDLVFFASGGTIYHVAIYAGHGWIWAAPYPGRDVEKEKLWTSNFLAGHVR